MPAAGLEPAMVLVMQDGPFVRSGTPTLVGVGRFELPWLARPVYSRVLSSARAHTLDHHRGDGTRTRCHGCCMRRPVRQGSVPVVVCGTMNYQRREDLNPGSGLRSGGGLALTKHLPV